MNFYPLITLLLSVILTILLICTPKSNNNVNQTLKKLNFKFYLSVVLMILIVISSILTSIIPSLNLDFTIDRLHYHSITIVTSILVILMIIGNTYAMVVLDISRDENRNKNIKKNK